MFLKKLESVGFKSFAERVSVDFVPGVTAVVGPNGSGKSNITDAIRWVLGEQSAKSLRGTKMEDIIFQGSDTRKALNVAEVTLILDNHDQALPIDYEEVSVTRRVYRSGESEYLLNKQSCRLKDIVDLFMDSGLGRDAFSIISQGKVEEILSSKAEERRTIFEEAAGVLKYKNRKKKAEYKLAETQENLNRVEDITHEIEKQLEPLQQQASTAKEYIAKKESLKTKEIALLNAEIETLHKQWSEYLEDIKENKDEEIAFTTSIQQKEAVLERERQDMQQLDQSIEVLQEKLLASTQELENLEGNKKLMEERSKHFTENKEKLETELETLQVRITSIEDELNTQTEKLTELESVRNQTKQQTNIVKTQLDQSSENSEEKIEELKSDYIELLNEQAAKRNAKQSIEQQLNQMDYRQKNQESKFEDQLAQRDTLTSVLTDYQGQLEVQHANRKQKEDGLHADKEKIEQIKEEYQASQTKLNQGYQYIEKLKSKKEMLEDMKEDFQGFFQGVKAILKAREEKRLSGVHGAVIELLDVPKEYVTAMETALGGQTQHIVVDDEGIARRAIEWLKQSNNGRATFLPLKTMRAKSLPLNLKQKVENQSGFIGVASDLIHFDEKYDGVIRYLLGNTIFASTLKDANAIAGTLERRYRVVTIEGDIVNPGGSMSGGARKNTNQSLFTRDNDLQDVTNKLTKFNQNIIEFEEKVNKQKQLIFEKEVDLEQARTSIQTMQQEENKLREQMAENQANIRHINSNLSIYDQEKAQFEKDKKELTDKKHQIEETLILLEEQLASRQAEINRLTSEKNTHQENYTDLKENYHRLQVKLAEQEGQVQHQLEKTEILEQTFRELQTSEKNITQQLNELIAFHQTDDKQLAFEEKVVQKQAEKQEVTESIQSNRQKRLKQTQFIEDAEREIKTLLNQRQAITEMIQQKEVKATRLDVELENRLNHLQTEYVITYEKAKATYPTAEDINQASQDVKLIKRSIEELGTVNLGAIDEYDRIAERYEFLTAQQTDLLEAKETLYSVIGEMDDEMKRKFETTFYQIKEEFSVVFEQLFGGGHAALILTDPTDMLETGVDIKAQPPGKKAQQLGLLSGGERALTAIALLFAILRVRPVPFCVLDEVEAALDDANVNRFARYLKDYSENTQFIVITHRKGTMEEADVLYGVTMQESGVSRLVSVKLEETNDLVKTTI
ncbi:MULTISPECIES: chromosome segregation protein SMC [Paraliobacillus]|uniref:chromosome segregation protein SMC n=1 Tax=Paraliobacillus TaxID=200903 RepID=UPI000DD3E217|nr:MULTISPECIES: chromosome segregation protein SMC [Paraliobacillus]